MASNQVARKQLKDVLERGLGCPHGEWVFWRSPDGGSIYVGRPNASGSAVINHDQVEILKTSVFLTTFKNFAKANNRKVVLVGSVNFNGSVKRCTKLDWPTTRPKGRPLPLDQAPIEQIDDVDEESPVGLGPIVDDTVSVGFYRGLQRVASLQDRARQRGDTPAPRIITMPDNSWPVTSRPSAERIVPIDIHNLPF